MLHCSNFVGKKIIIGVKLMTVKWCQMFEEERRNVNSCIGQLLTVNTTDKVGYVNEITLANHYVKTE